MPRKLLIALLVISLLFELGLTGMMFFAPEKTAHRLLITFNSDTGFLAYITGWFCLFVSLICALALYQALNRRAGYHTLCYLLGLWWIGIGVGIYIAFKRPDNLLTDSLKGSLLVALTWWDARKVKKRSNPFL